MQRCSYHVVTVLSRQSSNSLDRSGARGDNGAMTSVRELSVITIAVVATLGLACGDDDGTGGLSNPTKPMVETTMDMELTDGVTTQAPTTDETTAAPTTTAATTTGADGTSTGEPPSTTGSDDPDTTTNTTGMTTQNPGTCGNGVIEGTEQCDGQDLNGFTCETLGNSGGTLQCDPVTCTFDTQLCESGDSGTTG